jgi:hypothetical protein
MASSNPPADSTPRLPDYVPAPAAALGPALNAEFGAATEVAV